MRTFLQLTAIVAVGSALGLLLNAISPAPARLGLPVFAAAESGSASCSAPHAQGEAGPSGFATISREQAASLCTACTAGFVDARPASDFARGHIPNALHLPPHGHVDEGRVVRELRRFGTVVVYDSGLGCNLAEAVAAHLKSEGLSDVRILSGAWPAWEQSNAPAESGACAACEGRP
jgi:3-mercaptopyruvate sulfurtransferase SseA